MTIAPRVWLAAVLMAIAVPALAQEPPAMTQARQSGVIGERYDGYLGMPAAATEQVRRQVGATNIKRRSLYTDLATRRGANVQEVGIAAGCQLLASVQPGQSYMLADGQWRRRAAGEAPPVPSYCTR